MNWRDPSLFPSIVDNAFNKIDIRSIHIIINNLSGFHIQYPLLFDS